MKEFFELLRSMLPQDSRILYCQFRGSPEENIEGKWFARVLNNPDVLDDKANVYLCVSAMKKDPVVGWKRRKDCFAGGLLLMIDDVGDGAGSKFPLSHIDKLPPTALIETSPDNYQAVYVFDKPILDQRKFDALIHAFVRAEFLDKDPGMKGVTRVFRPPFGINGKEKHMRDGKPFQVRMAVWNPTARYSYEEVCAAFNLIPLEAAPKRKPRVQNDEMDTRIAAFWAAFNRLTKLGMFKYGDAEDHDWAHIRCPWTDNHTGRVDNGAGVRVPNPENEWYGGFKCHHGSCFQKGWRDLTDYLQFLDEVELEEANDYWSALKEVPICALLK